MELMENMLLSYQDDKTIRVVYCDRLSSIIYAIDMKGTRWPYVIAKDTLLSDFQKEKIKTLDVDPFIRNIDEGKLSIATINKRDRAWEIVGFVFEQLDSEVLIFRSKYREEAIKQTIDFYNVNYTTVKNYLVRYWQGGKIKNALLPRFYLCGAPGKEKAVNDKKRGRPRKDGKNQGINIDEKIKKYFKVGLNRYYYNKRQNSLKTTYELIIKDFFTEKQKDVTGKEVSIITNPSMIPTYNQFLYWYRKMNNPKKELIKREGTRNYYQNHRAIIGDSTQDAGLGPGTLWQIDATQFDIYLVSSVNRNLIIGRPTLYLVMDVYSRVIVGCNVSLEPFNSYAGVMVALANAILPKEDYCKQLGITLDRNEWDVACVPNKVFADRGELNNPKIENAVAHLGISVHNSPPYRADAKGIIEQAFEQLNLKIKPFADGFVKDGKTTIERGNEDHRLKANLTIDEFTKIVIKCILFHNNYHVLSQYVLDEMMIEEEVEKIPIKIWKHGLKNMKGRLRTLPETTIKMHLLPTDFASVTSRGVRYKKMLYASDYTLKNNWFQLARINGSKKIKIWYDPRDLSNIYTVNEDGEFHRLTLLDHLTKFKDKGMEEINEIIKFEESLDKNSKEKELQAKMNLFNEIESIVEKGSKKTLSERDESLSKAKRLKGIRDNQKTERELQRKKVWEDKEVIGVSKETTTETINAEAHNKNHDELEVFRVLRDKNRDDEQ